MNDIQINVAQAEDLPELLEVRYDALYQSAWTYYSQREVKVLLQDSGINELRLMITDSLLFKAVNVDGAIIGSSGYYKGHLRHLYVHPDYQGLGIGKKLLHYTEKHFIKNAHISPILLRLGSALCSREFYLKNGYTLVENSQDWDGSHYIKFEKLLE